MNIVDKFQAKRLGVSEEKYEEAGKIACTIWKNLISEGKVINPFVHIKMPKSLMFIQVIFIIAMIDIGMLVYNKIFNIEIPETAMLVIGIVYITLALVGEYMVYHYDIKQFEKCLEEIVKWDKEHREEKESAWNEDYRVKKFIVPVSITYNTHKTNREVIIETLDAKTAMHIAIADFQHDGWIVDTDYQNYKQFKE